MKTMVERFEAKVDRSGDCHVWTGARNNPNRYGQIRWLGKVMSAHRVAWMRAYGMDIPLGLEVMHSCDNPPCVNPAHLSLGTRSENAKDAYSKGRRVTPNPPKNS